MQGVTSTDSLPSSYCIEDVCGTVGPYVTKFRQGKTDHIPRGDEVEL